MPGTASLRKVIQSVHQGRRGARSHPTFRSARGSASRRLLGGVYDEEEEHERKPKREREGHGQAVDEKVSVVYEVDVERGVDGCYEDEQVGGRIHDPYIGHARSTVRIAVALDTTTRTYLDTS